MSYRGTEASGLTRVKERRLGLVGFRNAVGIATPSLAKAKGLAVAKPKLLLLPALRFRSGRSSLQSTNRCRLVGCADRFSPPTRVKSGSPRASARKADWPSEPRCPR